MENLNSNIKQKRLKKVKRILGVASGVSVSGAFNAFIQNMGKKRLELIDTINDTPEKILEYKELFEQYGCQTKQDFLNYLDANSRISEVVVFLNNEYQKVSYTEYLGDAKEALAQYNYLNSHLSELIADNPQLIGVDTGSILLTFAIPMVIIASYLITRHKYKKLVKQNEMDNMM